MRLESIEFENIEFADSGSAYIYHDSIMSYLIPEDGENWRLSLHRY